MIVDLAAFQAVLALQHRVGGLFQVRFLDILPPQEIYDIFLWVTRPDGFDTSGSQTRNRSTACVV